MPEHPDTGQPDVITPRTEEPPGEVDPAAVNSHPESWHSTPLPQSVLALAVSTHPSQETVDLLAVVGLALVALAVRLIGLGWHPLSDAEANQAMVAWQVYRGQAPAELLYSPLLISLNVFSFGLLGDSDLTARLGPALLGSLLVVLPYLVRRQLGRAGTLATASLYALSPTVLFFSRTASGDMGAALGGLILVIGLNNWLETLTAAGASPTTGTRWLTLATIGLATLLVSCPGAYSLLLLVLIFGLVLTRQRAGQVIAFRPDWRVAGQALAVQWKWPALWLALLAVALATALLLNRDGLAAAFELPAVWLRGFALPGTSQVAELPSSPYAAFFLILLYEPLWLLTGLYGIGLAMARRRLLDIVLTWWFLAGVILDLARPGRSSGEVVLPLVPLGMLAGLALGRLWESLRREGQWPREGLISATGLLICAYTYVQVMIYSRSGGNLLYLPLAAVGLFAGSLIAFSLWYDRRSALRAAALALLFAASVFEVGSAVRLNYGASIDPRQILAVAPAGEGLPDLVRTLETVSSQRTGDKRLVNVVYDRGLGPALAWQLRRFDNAVGVDAVQSVSPLRVAGEDAAKGMPDVVISAGQIEAPEGNYVGQDFAIRARWAPVNLDGPALVRWILLRKSATLPGEDRAVLWVKQQAEDNK